MDLCLSGFAKFRFVEAVHRLLHLASSWPIAELLFWDSAGAVNRSVFDDGTGVQDALSVLDLVLDDVVRVSVRVRSRIANETSSFSFAIVRASAKDDATSIDGQLHWPHDDVEEPRAALQEELEDMMLQAACALRALIVISDEDDRSLVVSAEPRVLLPRGVAVAGWHIAGDFRQAFSDAGYRVKIANGGTIVSFPRSGEVPPIVKTWLRQEIVEARIHDDD